MTSNVILDVWRLHQDDSSVVIDQEPTFLTFLMEKSEQNRQLEGFCDNISLIKVLLNDLYCILDVWRLHQDDSSVVIDRETPFLTP